MDIDEVKLCDSVFHNLWVNHSPWIERTKYDGTGVTPIRVKHWNPDKPEGVCKTTVVTPKRMVKAFVKVINEPHYHCGYRITADMDSWDTCCADTVLQVALYGKVIYG
jgi:uncharacterized protein (DUF169 family)